MTIVDRYLAGRTVGLLARTLIAFIAIYVFIDFFTNRSQDIARYNVGWDVVATYYAAYTPRIILQSAPFALLVSALLVIGSAAQNNEITAMLAGGVGLRRLMTAPVLVAALFSGALLGMQETVGARAQAKSEEIDLDYFSTNTNLERRGISWANLSGGWTCHINKFNRVALTGEDVIMHLHTDKTVDQIEARRIYWDPADRAWVLEDGVWLTFDPEVERMMQTVIRQQIAPIKETPEDLFAMEARATTRTAAQLAGDIEAARERNVPTDAMRVAFHTKFAQPALSFVMIFLAIPFAVRLRAGGLAASFGTSIVIAMIYLVVFAAFVALGQAGRLSPITAAWAPNVLFLMTGLMLCYRTPT